MKKLDDIDYKILSELIKNSKTSDRKITKLLAVSQPTVTRRRDKLEKANLLEYTVIPNLAKLGFEILAFHFILWKTEYIHKYSREFMTEELDKARKRMKKVKTVMSEHPSIIFSSSGQGLGMNRMLISVHRRYADLIQFKSEIEKVCGQSYSRYESFLVSLKNDRILRSLTFKYLTERLRTKQVASQYPQPQQDRFL